MKYVMLILSVSLVGCGGSGGGSAPSSPAPSNGAPSCKSLYSVWTADADHEQWDLSGFESTSAVSDYQWTAYDNASCGYATNPNYAMNATIQKLASGPNTGDYVLNMAVVATLPNTGAGLAFGGQCGVYNVGTQGPYFNSGIGIVESSCDHLQICVANFSTCKMFH